MKSLNLLVIAAAFCIAATGCQTKPITLTYLPNHNPDLAASPSTNVDKITPDDKVWTTDLPNPTNYFGWTRQPTMLEAFTVHFDYDSSVVKSEEAPKLEHIAQYLKANPSNALSIEGHCDEQGTEEYNRSLGDRRALALREALAKLDVAPARMDTISFGKDRPVDTSSTQEANHLNRRGEFVVLSPPK